MKITDTRIGGIHVVEVERRQDSRGWFAEVFNPSIFGPHGLRTDVRMCNQALSAEAGTVRGLHWQDVPHGQEKLVWCPKGAIHDVAVDVSPVSPTFGKSFSILLSEQNGMALYVPDGCAHGWQALVDGSQIQYLIFKNGYYPPAELGIRPDDPSLKFKWPLPLMNLSKRDRSWPLLGWDSN